MKTYRQQVGSWGEGLAESYLTSRGHTLIGRNLRTPYGEIDLLTRDGDCLVFVEVKARTSASYGPPEAAVTQKKREHLLAAIQAYLQEHPEIDSDWRVDVIAIFKPSGRSPEITWFENALS